jgi:hypothetical protein
MYLLYKRIKSIIKYTSQEQHQRLSYINTLKQHFVTVYRNNLFGIKFTFDNQGYLSLQTKQLSQESLFMKYLLRTLFDINTVTLIFKDR